MNTFDITGSIISVNIIETGKSAKGKEWQKQEFLVQTDAKFNNIFAFHLFGENVDKYTDEIMIGKLVTVDFNIITGSNKEQTKYYTSLRAWRIIDESHTIKNEDPLTDDEPF